MLPTPIFVLVNISQQIFEKYPLIYVYFYDIENVTEMINYSRAYIRLKNSH